MRLHDTTHVGGAGLLRHRLACPLTRAPHRVLGHPTPRRIDASASATGESTGGPNKPSSWVPPKSILKISAELLKSGGLDVTRESAEAKASFDSHLTSLFVPVDLDHPGLRILNIDPPVLTVEGFMTPSECDDIVEAATASGLMLQSGVGVGGYAVKDTDDVRTSSTLAATTEVLSQHPQLAAALGVMLSRARGLLRGPLPPDGSAAFSRPSAPGVVAFELPQVARYQPGQHFLTHEDAFPTTVAAAKGFQRRATLLVYLNDCTEGGATKFDILGIAVQPRKGSALLFFPSFSNAIPDRRTLHTAQDAVTDKWVTQLWFSCGVRLAPQQQSGGQPPIHVKQLSGPVSGPAAVKAQKRGGVPRPSKPKRR